eukprot:TRINITY_DN3399_c4_g1_i1.p1 TRINITY_DN3399_c4_g1~~TRINITY_DN3399_c4_g1_i1.p1  ORF type:complete len:421 (+),score=97.17 TRINITY_DN3399_c4_g1_i1:111-1265(+)
MAPGKKKPVPALAPVAPPEKEFNITDSLTLQVEMPDGKQARVGRAGLEVGHEGQDDAGASRPASAAAGTSRPAIESLTPEMPHRARYNFEDLKMGEVIGEGSQAKVRKVKHVPTKKILALKIISFGPDMTRKVLQTEISRVSIVDNHPNLVNSLEAYFKEGYLMVLMEYMQFGTLSSLASKAHKAGMFVPDLVLSRMTKQILSGLNHLHTGGGSGKGLIHRDLKPSNILVNSDGTVKISDFGVATFLQDQQKMAFTAVGSTAYMSPERVRGEGYTTASDIWAVGITVAELALGTFPLGGPGGKSMQLFELCSVIAEERAVINWPHTLPDGTAPSPEMTDFVLKCMEQKPDTRPDAATLLDHPFIKKHEGREIDMAQWCRQACGK